MKIKTLSAAVAVALLSSSAFAVEYHGYARSGVGISDDGAQSCSAQKQKVGRLGNECETYAELTLKQEVHNNDSKIFNIATTLAYTSDGSNDWEGTGDDNDAAFAIREMYATGTGVLNFAPEATVWAGKRFYQRNDIHIVDFYYWDISGAGAGIEGIKAGSGALNFAWTRSDRADGFTSGSTSAVTDGTGTPTGDTVNIPGNTGVAANVNNFDVRYTGLKLGASNSLDFGLTYGMANLTDAQEASGKKADDGVMLTAQLTSSILGGFNKAVIQYGTEGYAHALRYFGGGNWYGAENTGQNGTAYRLINWGVVPAGEKVDIGYSFNYASYDRDDFANAHDYFNVVVRPSYKWNDYHKTILEAGYYSADDDAWGEETLSKVTVAQAISAGNGFWARPELRVFASYVKTHEDGSTFSNSEDNEVNFGVQMEAWW
ncbi:maltoporin [Psychromonas ossibalaenae]|uniref:maltoporin n=1 Tax=Psychromonas ossibalaenae TaxID=444922 RepID=UPI00037BA195|nr:maltoporin [Psychromonas ossibalaenae]